MSASAGREISPQEGLEITLQMIDAIHDGALDHLGEKARLCMGQVLLSAGARLARIGPYRVSKPVKRKARRAKS